MEDLFYKYGKIVTIDVKNAQPGGNNSYCFIEFGHPDDAYDAVKGMDGRNLWGKRIRVSCSALYCLFGNKLAVNSLHCHVERQKRGAFGAASAGQAEEGSTVGLVNSGGRNMCVLTLISIMRCCCLSSSGSKGMKW